MVVNISLDPHYCLDIFFTCYSAIQPPDVLRPFPITMFSHHLTLFPSTPVNLYVYIQYRVWFTSSWPHCCTCPCVYCCQPDSCFCMICFVCLTIFVSAVFFIFSILDLQPWIVAPLVCSLELWSLLNCLPAWFHSLPVSWLIFIPVWISIVWTVGKSVFKQLWSIHCSSLSDCLPAFDSSPWLELKYTNCNRAESVKRA